MASDQPFIDPSDELIGKTVGRRGPPRALENVTTDSKERSAVWSRAFETPFVPRGVYRFRTHEEADAWLWAMITRTKRRP